MLPSSPTQQSRHYSQAFGRNVFTEILRWGDSETLTSLCHNSRHRSDDTYLNCIHRFYHMMKQHYRCEYVFKNELIRYLCHRYSNKNVFVANEFRVNNSFADLAFFNGESCAYEIKTSYDTPRRLLRQINAYKCVFDKCYIVVEESEVTQWESYNEAIGIIACCHGEKGRIWFKEIRPAIINNELNVEAVMSCLRTCEYEWIAEHYGKSPLMSPKYQHYEECKRILLKMPQAQLRSAFLRAIALRKCNFELLNQAPRELYQICLSMHLSTLQLNTITQSLNNKVF